MIDWKKLFSTKEYWVENIQNDLYGKVKEYLEKKNITQTQFADEIGVDKSYISQVLNGKFDHKLSKLVELYLAIGKAPLIFGVDLETYTQNTINEITAYVEFRKESPSIDTAAGYWTMNQAPGYLYTSQMPRKDNATLRRNWPVFNRQPSLGDMAQSTK